MRDFIESRKARLMVGAGTLATTTAAVTGQALAVPEYDLAPVSTGFTEQVQAALAIGLPIAAGLIALSVGIAWVRKLLKSK